MELIARHLDREEKVLLARTARGYRVTVGDATHEVDAAAAGDGTHSLVIDGCQHEVLVQSQGDGRYRVTTATGAETVELMDPLTHLARQAHGDLGVGGPQQVTAYMPGRVVEILVEEGARLEPGAGVLVLEAMKMKNEIQSEGGGTVRRILVTEGQAVEGGDPLFEIE